MKTEKVLLVYKNDDSFKIESIHTHKIGKYYQVDNIPFFANNIAFGDLISVESDEGALYFEKLVKASGHSTIQLVFFNIEYKKNITGWLEGIGCSWEGSHIHALIAIDIPPSIDYAPIKERLEELKDNNIIDYKEACLANGHQ